MSPNANMQGVGVEQGSEYEGDHVEKLDVTAASIEEIDEETRAVEPYGDFSTPMTDDGGSSSEPCQLKFESYPIKTDPEQNDKASEIRICSFARPHMRAFHFAWWSYHVAFLMWFSISPLLTEVQESLDLTTEQIWSSSISAVTGTIVMRFILGPFCDKFGPRIPMGIILAASAIPTGMTGLVNTATGLTILRFFIGIGGSTFVMAQYWTSTMFTKEWVGTANATVGGWGNLGGGITQVMIGSILFPLFRTIYNGDREKAWRTVCIFPALLGLGTAYGVIRFTDDSPRGNYSKLKKQQQMKSVSVWESIRRGTLNFNTWLLFVQYACCFGVEITMNNAAALYFKDEFGLSTESAAAIASIFGWMNLFARGLGGFCSDVANRRFGMKGRLCWQSFVLLMEGTMVLIFAQSTSLVAAIAVLVFFSIFVQAAEGSTYGIVPYVNPPITGSISGIIGAGGNVGAMAFSFCFRQLSAKSAFTIMGGIIVVSSILSIFVVIPNQSGLIWNGRGTIDDLVLTETASKEESEQGTEPSSESSSHNKGQHEGSVVEIDEESNQLEVSRDESL
mmetsp:Transcript_31562/g.46833  ORF Transcript_31562/g.46833 Transcript_31562/m.46833 type:complete len:563 (-) Transcript_31562:262-1950(-)|eukprot:CAMPEP_0194027212 /NCGR_PEP_ID=MMETSP0009_2-20130614/1387_1 /TAXON_ID=210454 /ORGANISM="Grammatophora oceanica, Strain CCMP 410" /LENGTH=562 /DNA_ID=CAMNT_0038666183 /DNA_START=124 /DNA_END=1812 /DNA_ORIENTATION=+